MSASYETRDDGTFIVHDYHQAPPFSNMFPGVAGVWGTPMWLFWVNRGQCVACFGTRDKDRAIMEFQSANLHYRRTALEGFRTFMRGETGNREFRYEPFQHALAGDAVSTMLVQKSGELRIVETSREHGLRTEVTYFAIPGEPFAALARILRVTNTAQTHCTMQLADGFPNVTPYGLSHFNRKMMPFISDGYLVVKRLEDRMPYFTLGSVPGDESETEFVRAGNFYLAFTLDRAAARFAPVIVDPALLFGEYNDRIHPYAFFDDAPFVVADRQNTVCQTPCAFACIDVRLAPGETAELYSLAGCARSTEQHLAISSRVSRPGYMLRKQAENAATLERIKDRFFVHGGNQLFDRYIQQSFLDNALRGGLPLSLPAGKRTVVYHVFSRKHGDLERDYNNFDIEPTFFSRGPGNYRDVNQNRRNDVWFNPDVADSNVRYFCNLLQADGFNPLLCEGASFRINEPEAIESALSEFFDAGDRDRMRPALAGNFTPGGLFEAIQENRARLTTQAERFLERVLEAAEVVEHARFGHGYWSDHWMYCLDQLESFRAIFPDRFERLCLHDHTFTYWDTDIEVLPRDEKYVLNRNGEVRHLRSIRRNPDKTALIHSRGPNAYRMRTGHGRREIYRGNLLGKLLCLAANKMASVAPSGFGIEMDGGRPGWCDSVNGLPALFGAGMPEMRRLQALIALIRSLAGMVPDWSQAVPVEVSDLMREVDAAAARLIAAKQGGDFAYWDSVSTAKERYRKRIAMGFDGEERMLGAREIADWCTSCEARLQRSIERALYPGTRLPVTYVTHEAVDYEVLMEPASHGARVPRRNADGLDCVRISAFRHHFFAPFLEGAVYAMESCARQDEARDIWRAVRESPLYDRPLKMYKISAGLDAESREQGRTGGWAKGWFENESIFSHVEFKYLLRLLQRGLYEEFFEDLKTCLPPFLDPAVYGRSILENASFIVCSAHQRQSWHGRAMQPRLSGTNAEMLHIALHMCFGPRPFTRENGELRLGLSPVLPGWAFSRNESSRAMEKPEGGKFHCKFPQRSFSALFLGKTLVTYENPQRRDTFGAAGARVRGYRCVGPDGARREVAGPLLRGRDAEDARDGAFERVIVSLAP
jgi:hypothetical protein